MELKDIKVLQLDVEALNKSVDEYMKAGDQVSDEDKEKYDYKLREHKLCIATSEMGTKAIFDTELCGNIASEGKCPVDIVRNKKEGGGMDLFPVATLTVVIDELLKMENTDVDVKDFMGTRYNYNSRIKKNQEVFLNFIKTE